MDGFFQVRHVPAVSPLKLFKRKKETRMGITDIIKRTFLEGYATSEINVTTVLSASFSRR